MYRKEKLVTNEIYHIYNKSIAGYKIFNSEDDFSRFKDMLWYFHYTNTRSPFSKFFRYNSKPNMSFKLTTDSSLENRGELVQIIAYCIMQTHFHLVVKQISDDGATSFMHKVLNSYSHYFNLKHNRRGPLWQGRFQYERVKTDEQLMHLTRYVHLNPTTAYVCDRPEEWKASSYGEYVGTTNSEDKICSFAGVHNMSASDYREFVMEQIESQREAARAGKEQTLTFSN